MAHTSSCRNTRIEPLKPVSTCFGEIRETEGSLLFPVSQVGPPSGPRFDPENQRIDRLSTRSSCLCDLIFDSNVLDSGYFACNLYRYVSRWKFRRSEILVLFFLRCLYSSCNYRFFTYFFFFLTFLVPRRWRSFEISMDRLLSNPRARTSMPSFHRVKRATNCTTVRTFTRTSKEPREQRWPSTRETFHEIIYWSIKMTHGGIR